MPVLPLFLVSFCLVFRSCFLGAMVVTSLDFWLNLGLSWLQKATRLSRLEFGRNIFEFGRPVVPDLTTVVGNRCFSASCYRKLLFLRLEQYYRSRWSGTTAWARAVLLLSLERYYRLTSSGTTTLFGAVLPLGRYYRGHVTVLPLHAKFHQIPTLP